ncbi:MAG: toprim domain-containing protein [Candidatus Nanoarchaeia archaeon]
MITKKFTNERYCISLRVVVEGTIESVDVIGSLYKQLQDVLSNEVHFETLVKEGKIGLISVSITKQNSKSIAQCQIPTSLDFKTTCLLAAKCEQITKIGHTHGKVEVTNIAHSHQELEAAIANRAKELEQQFSNQDATNSSQSNTQIHSNKKDNNEETKSVIEIAPNCYSTPECMEYITTHSTPKIILVEGRSDVKTLAHFGYKNVISTNGSYMSILQLKDKNWFQSAQFYACLDGDSSAKKLITQYTDHFPIQHRIFAPRGREVSSLNYKQVEKLISKLNYSSAPEKNDSKPDKQAEDKTKTNSKTQMVKEKQDKTKSKSLDNTNINIEDNSNSSLYDTAKNIVIEKQHFTKYEYVALENYIELLKDNARIVGFDSTMGLLFDEPISKLKSIDYTNCSILLLNGLFENSLYSKIKHIDTLYCVIARGFSDSYNNLLTITFKEFEESSFE